MAKFIPALTEGLIAFIAEQRLFFVGSAPRQGRVNLSPKGMDTFRVLSATQVGYLDMTGSGNETAAHLRENGRATFMFCAFEGAPMILRLYTTGRTVLPSHKEWKSIRSHFGPPLPGERQLIIADIESVQTSCGFGVPMYTFQEERTQLITWAEKKGPEGVKAYRREKNLLSIDGLSTGYSDTPP